jgi:hypothetical protein
LAESKVGCGFELVRGGQEALLLQEIIKAKKKARPDETRVRVRVGVRVIKTRQNKALAHRR